MNRISNKLLMSTVCALATALTLQAATDKQLVLDYAGKQLDNAKVKSKNLKVDETQSMGQDWEAIKISFDVEENGKFKHAEEVVISNGDYIVSDAINLRTMDTIRNEYASKNGLFPNVSSEDYKNSILITGNKNAKHKILVFTDPFCPFCKEELKKLLPKLKDKKEVALYIQQIPLNIHPASHLVIQHILASKDKAGNMIKVYEAKESNAIVSSTDFETINKWFENITGEKIQKDSLLKTDKTIKDVVATAQALNVSGTPTVFIDGKRATKRNAVKNFLNTIK